MTHSESLKPTEVFNDNTKFDTQSNSSGSEEEQVSVPKVPFAKSEAEKKLVRKLNMRLLPIAGMIIFMQFTDKAALSVAAVLGMLEETHTSKSQYSWLGSLFSLGYLVFQLPNSYFLQKFPISRYMGTLLICWGAVTLGTAFAKSFTQLAVLRVLLGIFEAGTYPTLLLLFNTMYRRSEQSACFGFLFLSNGVGSMIGSASSYGVSSMDNIYGIPPWKINYLIWGSITVVTGFVTFFFMIDSPNSWVLSLTEEEKLIMAARTKDNAVVRKGKIEHDQYWEALKEPRLWLICVATLCNQLQSGGLILFSTVLVRSLGFNSRQSILLQIPSGAATVAYIALAVFLHRRTKQLILTDCLLAFISMTGCLLLATLPQSGIKLLGYYLTWAQVGSHVLTMALLASSVSGYSKKIFYNAVNMIFYTLGNFLGPLMVVDSQAPRYPAAMWGYFAANIVVILCLVLIRFWLSDLNKKRRNQRTEVPTDVHLNLTDRQDPNYIYHL